MIEEINVGNQSEQQPLEQSQGISKTSGLKKFLARKNLIIGISLVGIIAFGVLSGWLLTGGKSSSSRLLQTGVVEGERPKKGEEFGVQNKEVFSDNAVGQVAEGGINGEGTHRLLRVGGSSQTVFLFSSVLDLDTFIDRRVEVWGETFSAEKAGWLMDVGKLKVLD